MNELFIDQEFRSLIPPLSPGEYAGLEQSLIDEGNRVPIDTWNGYLVDGHNRYDICHKHNIPLKPANELKHLKTRNDVLIWIIRNQLDRRNLNPYQRSTLALQLEGRIAEKAKENQGKRTDILQNSVKSFDTQKELAKQAKVSHDTIWKVKQINGKANEEQRRKLETGEVSINEAYRLLVNGAHVNHATGESEWYTPSEYIESARSVMGSIDTDPASTDKANEIVKAKQYFTADNDGRIQQWQGNVWMNPPYSQPLIKEFTSLLVKKYADGEIGQACVLVNNATETEFYQEMLRTCQAVCFIKGRVKFIDAEGNASGAPLQGQTVLYFGQNKGVFAKHFQKYGVVLYAH